MVSEDIREYLEERRALIARALDARLPTEDTEPGLVHEAMRYAVLSEGKRLRPILMLAVAEIGGETRDRLMDAACGIELLHTASLVLDDLPSMDNAQLRRNIECTHVKYGEATALLAAMGLVALAFDLVARNGAALGRLEASQQAVRELAHAMGTTGIVHGQHVDLGLKDRLVTIEQLDSVHENKAAALFLASVRIPAVFVALPESEIVALTTYAQCLGLAFQITDDLLDAHRSAEDKGKTTHATHLGTEGACERVSRLVSEAVAALGPLSERARLLRLMAEHVRTRTF